MSKIKSFLRDKKGISNIIGTMLMVVVVVVAVSGFATVIAGIQKNESDRLNNIAAVESEILKITDVSPFVNGTELYGLNFTLLNLNSRDARIVAVLINDRAAINFTSTDDYNEQGNFSFYNRMKLLPGKNKVISIDFKNFNPEYNLSITEPLEIAVFTSNANIFKRLFNPPKAVIKSSIETEKHGAVERDVLVLDGSGSYDDGSINSYNWLISNDTGNVTPEDIIYNVTGKTERLTLNKSGPFYISLTVRDDTNMIGVSEITIPKNINFNPQPIPPTPVIKASVETEDIGVTYRDVLVLDGSDSYDDDGSIVGYNWVITNNTGNILLSTTGKKIRAILSQSGPFNVSLTVEDNTESFAVQQVKIPENKNFNPPVSMTAYYSSGPKKIYATLKDINSNPSENITVYFITISGNVTFSPSNDITDYSGEASTTINAGVGLIQAHSGNLNPVDISIT